MCPSDRRPTADHADGTRRRFQSNAAGFVDSIDVIVAGRDRMLVMASPILLTSQPVPRDEIARLVDLYFGGMVKFVVDVERGVIALASFIST